MVDTNVSNTPFREYKKWIHEGGISTPLIAHWPEGIRRDINGTLVTEPTHLVDLMVTCVDVSNVTYPETHKGHTIIPMAGESLEPLFRGESLRRERSLGFEHMGNRGIRQGQWKLVAVKGGQWELYDMEKDRTELHDLAATFPERVKTMADEYEVWAERCFVNRKERDAGKRATAAKFRAIPVTTHVTTREPGSLQRTYKTPGEHLYPELPDELRGLPSVLAERGSYTEPGAGFKFRISALATVYIAVQNRGDFEPPKDWQKMPLRLVWSKKHRDSVYMKSFPAGVVEIPGHTGRSGTMYGVPHVAFVKGNNVEIFPCAESGASGGPSDGVKARAPANE